MSKKLFLLPGFGENASCFRNLKPFLRAYEVVDIDYRPILKTIKLWEVQPSHFVKKLIKFYEIKESDQLIGHSMGGYFAYIVSILQGNKVCLINSFTTTDKIVRFSNNQLLNHFMTGSGIVKTSFMRNYIAKRNKDMGMRNEMLRIQKDFRDFSNASMMKMSMLSFGEQLPPASIQPLHLHAKDDRVVRKPDHAFVPVRGAHFSMVFHPDEVYEKIEVWLESLKAPALVYS